MLTPNIPFTRLKITMAAAEPIRLPAFSGSAFRGAFGAALRRACCTMSIKNCRECMLKTSCVYASVFETGSDHAGAGGYQLSDYPRPFIIEPDFPVPKIIDAGEQFACHLILFGNAVAYLPYFIYAFSEMGKSGLGTAKGRFRIIRATNAIRADEDVIFNGDTQQFQQPPQTGSIKDFFSSVQTAEAATLSFETPTRIKDQNRLTVHLSFHLLIKNLFRRLLLMCQICGEPLEIPNIKSMLSEAQTVEISRSSLYWHDWTRYSSRQKDLMKLGGFMGDIRYTGDLSPFIPFIQAGEFLHVGKACTFGLGKYRAGTAENHFPPDM